MVCHCLPSPPWWISNLNVKTSAELEFYCFDSHQCKDVLWARLMPYNTYEKFPEIVTLTLLGNSPPLLVCRTSSNACKICVAKCLVLLGELRKGSEEWKLIMENYSEPKRLVMETTVMLSMRTLQHNCYSAPRCIGYLPLSRDLSHLFFIESRNSPLKQWAKHSNIKKQKWEYCLVTWAQKIFILMERENCYNTVKAVVLWKTGLAFPNTLQI